MIADERKAVDSLYLISWTGTLIEYVLEPHPKTGADKVTDETPLDCTGTPRAQWMLGRYVMILQESRDVINTGTRKYIQYCSDVA